MGLLDRLRGRQQEPPPGPLADLAAAPVVDRQTPVEEVELLALDLETTGLDPRRHEVLSIGLVPVSGAGIHLEGARHWTVRPRGEVGESATVHGLTDDALADAPPLEDVLPDLVRALTGPRRRVLLAHFAQIETDFLDAASRAVYGIPLPQLQVVDTLHLELSSLGRPIHEVPAGRVRLDACRRVRGLPRYSAHNAATDALACAELFLAQSAELAHGWGRTVTLGDVLRRHR